MATYRINAGRIRPVFRGEWDASATYSYFDVVSRVASGAGASSYIYLSEMAGNILPPEDAGSPWTLYAGGGADGESGAAIEENSFEAISVRDGSAVILPGNPTDVYQYLVFAFSSEGAVADFAAGVATGGTEIFGVDSARALYFGYRKKVR